MIDEDERNADSDEVADVDPLIAERAANLEEFIELSVGSQIALMQDRIEVADEMMVLLKEADLIPIAGLSLAITYWSIIETAQKMWNRGMGLPEECKMPKEA
jgi:hypothetical protein